MAKDKLVVDPTWEWQCPKEFEDMLTKLGLYEVMSRSVRTVARSKDTLEIKHANGRIDAIHRMIRIYRDLAYIERTERKALGQSDGDAEVIKSKIEGIELLPYDDMEE